MAWTMPALSQEISLSMISLPAAPTRAMASKSSPSPTAAMPTSKTCKRSPALPADRNTLAPRRTYSRSTSRSAHSSRIKDAGLLLSTQTYIAQLLQPAIDHSIEISRVWYSVCLGKERSQILVEPDDDEGSLEHGTLLQWTKGRP